MKVLKPIGYWRDTEVLPMSFTGTGSGSPFADLAVAFTQVANTALPWPEPNGRLAQEAKERVAVYLRQGLVNDVYKGKAYCKLCHADLGSSDLTDGEFVWPEGYAHYVLEHNVMPDLDLLAKVLSTPNEKGQSA